MPPEVRQHYLDLAELAALVARYDRAAAEAVFAPVADRLVGLDDELWGWGRGPRIFRAAGAFDARVARALLEALPEDPTPAGRPAERRAELPRTTARPRPGSPWPGSSACPPRLRLREPVPSR